IEAYPPSLPRFDEEELVVADYRWFPAQYANAQARRREQPVLHLLMPELSRHRISAASLHSQQVIQVHDVHLGSSSGIADTLTRHPASNHSGARTDLELSNMCHLIPVHQ